jgi:hypothetical protein
MDHWHALLDHIALIGTVGRTPVTTRLMEALLIALVTSYATTAMTAARLEERIAALDQRQKTCEAQIAAHMAEDLSERDRISKCEATLANVRGRP